MIAANSVITNLVLAVIVGLAIRLCWLWSFIGDVIRSGLIGGRYESTFFELIGRESE